MPTAAVPSSAIDAAKGALSTYFALHPEAASRPDAPSGPPTTSAGDESVYNYFIRLDELKKWDGKDPQKLFHPTGEVISTIKSGDMVASAVTLEEQGNTWKSVAFGPSDEAKTRSEALQRFEKSAPGGAFSAPAFQVTVPSLNAAFVAKVVDSKLMLDSIKSLPALGIEAGKEGPADEVLRLLQQRALTISGDKPG